MKSKKIGILNFHYSDENYGAVLQAYALQSYLNNLGYKATTINFLNYPRRPDLIVKKIIALVFQSNPFKRFRKKWLQPLTAPIFWPFQLKDKKLGFDTYIVGSDQVWRAGKTNVGNPHTVYYLSFVPDTKKKIAYAASFGIDYWDALQNKSYTETVKKEIQRFDAISIRELSGVDICSQVFEVESVHVLDPTLLVGRSYFDKIIGKKQVDNGKIVFYKLDTDEDFNKAISYLSEKLNAPVENIYYSSSSSILGQRVNAFYEVSDWLQEIQNAKLVVTDSFHAVCFCLLFEKQFVYYPNIWRGITRVEGLLKALSINSRIYFSAEDIKNDNAWEEEIDYKMVNKILEEERRKSAYFLNEVLEK